LVCVAFLVAALLVTRSVRFVRAAPPAFAFTFAACYLPLHYRLPRASVSVRAVTSSSLLARLRYWLVAARFLVRARNVLRLLPGCYVRVRIPVRSRVRSFVHGCTPLHVYPHGHLSRSRLRFGSGCRLLRTTGLVLRTPDYFWLPVLGYDAPLILLAVSSADSTACAFCYVGFCARFLLLRIATRFVCTDYCLLHRLVDSPARYAIYRGCAVCLLRVLPHVPLRRSFAFAFNTTRLRSPRCVRCRATVTFVTFALCLYVARLLVLWLLDCAHAPDSRFSCTCLSDLLLRFSC